MGEILEAVIEALAEVLIEGMADAAGSPKLPKILRYIIATGLFIIVAAIFLLLFLTLKPNEIPQKVLICALGAFCLLLFISLIRDIRKSKN